MTLTNVILRSKGFTIITTYVDTILLGRIYCAYWLRDHEQKKLTKKSEQEIERLIRQ